MYFPYIKRKILKQKYTKIKFFIYSRQGVETTCNFSRPPESLQDHIPTVRVGKTNLSQIRHITLKWFDGFIKITRRLKPLGTTYVTYLLAV